VEQLSLKRRWWGGVEEEEAEVADAEVALGLDSAYHQVSASGWMGCCPNASVPFMVV
jgi:hypothetical protein